MKPVLLRGDGVAAHCCAHLLDRQGIPFVMTRLNRPRIPAIMLSEIAVALLADIFEQNDLFRDAPRIRSRVVLWGSDAEPVTLPHSAVVVSEQELLDNVRSRAAIGESASDASWHVFAAHPLPADAEEQRFGSRIAHTSAVELSDGGSPGCWVESVDDGWLFLVGRGNGKGWLISVGSATGTALARSRLIAPQIEQIGEPGGDFPAFPRMLTPLCRGTQQGGWLACGTAAMAFDPLCGDGTAHAVREAILTVAVIRAVCSGVSAAEVLQHYQARLTVGFQRHLTNCAEFYRTGGASPWWQAELKAVERGLVWCAERMSNFPKFRYRLIGFDLEALA